MNQPSQAADCVLLIGFGGPESPEEILPFLRNVVRGRNIPDARLVDVERHYHEVGGRSPYNEWTERQRRGLEEWLAGNGCPLPVAVGMRNWRPFLADTVRKMADEGRRHLVGVILAPHQSEVSWQRYQQDVQEAMSGYGALSIRYLEPWFDHPRFLEACAQRLEEITGQRRGRWPATLPVIFTAHSIPEKMAHGCPYVEQLQTTCQGVATLLGLPDWELAYQSRTGSPAVPWLEPDINDAIRLRASEGAREIAVSAIGFLCDHVEVLYDLDIEAQQTSEKAGVKLHRAGCVNDHPEFIAMLGELVRSQSRP